MILRSSVAQLSYLSTAVTVYLAPQYLPLGSSKSLEAGGSSDTFALLSVVRGGRLLCASRFSEPGRGIIADLLDGDV